MIALFVFVPWNAASSHCNLRPQSALSSSLSSLGHTCHAQQRHNNASGKEVSSKPKLPFQPRYGNSLHPIHAFLTVPREQQPVSGDSSNSNCLTVPSAYKNMNKFKCYKTPKDNELCLCEDIFQQHQAKLIDCDSEDAKAVSSYTHNTESEQVKENVDVDTASSSMSECCCNHSDNTTSTQSSDNNSESKQEVHQSTSVDIVETNKDKLTLEEREKALKELDEIINSIKITRNIREFGSLDLSTSDRNKDFKKSRFLSSMLELNFSEMKIDDKDDNKLNNNNMDPDNRELNNNISNNESEEPAEFTVGKVARLAKFFSNMGEAGIIRTKGNRAINRQFKSEPNISFNEEERRQDIGKINLSMENLCNNVPCSNDSHDNGAMENYKTEPCDASEPTMVDIEVNREGQYNSKCDRIEIDDSSSTSSSSTNKILFAPSKTLNVDELDRISRSDSSDSRKLDSDVSLDFDSMKTVLPSNHIYQKIKEKSSSSDTSSHDKASYSEKQDRFKHIKDSFFNNTISDETNSSGETFKHIHNFLLKEELLKQRMKSGSIDMHHMGDTFDIDIEDETSSTEQRRRKLISQKTMDCRSNFSFTKDPSSLETPIPQREKLKRWYSDQIFDEPCDEFGSKDIFRRVLRNNLNKTKFRAKRMRNVIVTPIKIHQRIILRQDQEGIEEEDGIEPCRKL